METKITKALDVLKSQAYTYECLEGVLTIVGDDGYKFDIDLNKLDSDMLEKLM